MEEGKVPKKETEDSLDNNHHDFNDELHYFMPLVFCRVGSSNLIEFCSRVFKEFTGYEEEEILGSKPSSFFKENEKIEELISWNEKERDVKDGYFTLLNKKGEEIPVKASVGTIFNKSGTLCGYFVTAIEITDKKELEEELERKIKERTEEIEKTKEQLQESEQVLEVRVKARTRQLRELAENLEEKAKKRMKALEEKTREVEKKAKMEEKSRKALLNLAEDLEEASQRAQEEKEKTMAIVNNFTDGLLFFDRYENLKFVNPQAENIFSLSSDDVIDKKRGELKKLDANLSKTIDVVDQNTDNVFREEVNFGESVFMEVSSVQVHYEEETIGSLIIVHDITREKNLEKMKNEFVSLAAHQLRTPLAGIKWTLRTLSEEIEGMDSSSEINDMVVKAYEANERMINLVNDLLNVNRIEEDRNVYEMKEINIKEVIDLALEEYRGIVESKGLEFEMCEFKKGALTIKADKEELVLVLKNFLDNAVKYTEEGKITLKVEFLDGDEKVKVEVSDTGVGIPKEHRDKMFDKFSRAENVQRMDTEGSGLGLFISKNIVESHGGEIGFDSKEGEGSSFFFVLPVIGKGDMTE
ncbi:MAG: ATP-binding protein [Patescibacteria group bacterium]